MAPFDLSWTPELKNKLSTQIDGQLPDFIAEDHPQFSQFLKSYYHFLESGELQLTVNINNILLEIETPTNLLLEDGTLIVTEVGSIQERSSTGKFVNGEIITGGTSKATATVLVEDLGNATPRLFISSQQLFETGETVTGGTSGATGVVTKYRANPVQNIQQLLAYADIDNTIYDFIEEFRKSFMAGIPTNLANGINKRNLEKHITELYRRKGTKEAAKLFMKILLDEEAEVFYPNQFMMKPSAADWDKPTVIRCSGIGNVVVDELIGQSITGVTSGTTALVENASTFSISGGTSYVEIQISSVIGAFVVGENVYGISSKEDVRYTFTVNQLLSSVSNTNDGILYNTDDVLDLDTSILIGSGNISATVGKVERGSVSGVIIDDAGANYEVGDLVVFSDHASEAAGLINSAQGVVTSIHGGIVNETDGDAIVQEDGTDTFIDLFNFELEAGTVVNEEPYAVFGTSKTYGAAVGYYYPIYLSNYAAQQATILKSSASVNGATFNSTTVKLDGNAGDDIALGMVVKSNSINKDTVVTVTSITDQSTIILSAAHTFLDNEVLVFESIATAITRYTFDEYPGNFFYSPTATTVSAAATYNTTTYELYGGNFNHRSDHLYGESGNAAINSGGRNIELVLGDRFESEWAVNITVTDTNRRADEGFTLESGSGDISKITITDPGNGYLLLPTVTVRSQYGTNAKVFAITTDIGRISSVNVIDPGFSYTESPALNPRANFVIKDITGTFSVGAALTSHTGTVRGYDSTTQVLEVSIEDTVSIEDESQGNTYNEGIRLEDSLIVNEYVTDNIIINADLVYEDNLVDQDGDRLLIDATSSSTEFIRLEDDQGELAMEFPQIVELAQILLEDGEGSLRSEPDVLDGTRYFLCQESGFKTGSEAFLYELRQVKFITENSPDIITTDGGGNFIILNADISYEDDLLLNGTDSSSTNAGEKLLLNATDSSGTNDPSNLIVLEAGVTNSANEKLLYETNIPFTNLVLNGTNAALLHASEKILFEDVGIDFSAGTTSITTAAASATIAHADIAKLNFNLGASADKIGRFSGIENLISEELIRIQDSFYYQDFSYVIETSTGSDVYLNALKKSIHPAGFNVFSKVNTSTYISARASVGIAQPNINAESGLNDFFNRGLGTTFFSIFPDAINRRLGVTTGEEVNLLLENSIQQRVDDKFILEDGSEVGVDYEPDHPGEGFIQLEPPENVYLDFEAIQIIHGVGAGEFGVLLTEDSQDRIVSESAVVITNNLVIDSTSAGHLATSGTDAGSDLLTEDGLSFELEDSIQDGTSFMLSESTSFIERLLSEEESDIFVLEGVSQSDREVHVRSSFVTRLDATLNKSHNSGHGLLFLATTTINGITGDGIGLEVGNDQIGGRLLLNHPDLEDSFLLEDGSDVNVNQSVTKDTLSGLHSFNDEDFTRDSLIFFPNDNDGNEDDLIILEGSDTGTFKQEDGTTVAGTFGDDIILEEYTGFGIGVKLSLEKTFIARESSTDVGAKPFGIEEDVSLEPFTYPADIFVQSIGTLSLEASDNGSILIDHSGNTELVLESSEGGNILLETFFDDGHITLEGDDESTGFKYQLEDGTAIDTYVRLIDTRITDEFPFDGIVATFDNAFDNFDIEEV